MKHKRLFTSIIAVASVIIFFGVFLLVWFFGDTYKDFKTFKENVAIPGLSDGAVPQGLGNYTTTYEKEDGTSDSQQYFFISAYMMDGSASRIYVTGEKTGYVGYVTAKNVGGESDYTGHCGGLAIASNGSTLWVTSESTVFVAKVSSSDYNNIGAEIIAKAAKESAEEKVITFTTSFDANCNADFCYYYDDPSSSAVSSDRLYVGEFYRKGNYETSASHRVTTPNGYKNTAFVYEYNVSTSGNYGLSTLSSSDLDTDQKVPAIRKIFSIPEKIQGFAVTSDSGSTKLTLSQSYGLSNSHLLVYDWSSVTSSSNRVTYTSLGFGNFEYNGIKTTKGIQYTDSTLNVYYVDSNNEDLLLNDYSIPSMSEGLCANGSRVYVLFESAGKKYNKFVRQQVKNIYSVVPKTK